MIHQNEQRVLADFSKFRKKTAGSHEDLHGNISAPVQVTDLVEVSKDAASLVVCTLKNIFAWGVQVFC